MSVDVVREYMRKFNKDRDILEFDMSSATVSLAAQALNIQPGRIAKTLSFKKDDGCILVVTSGNVKIDNAKYRHTFGIKAKMLSQEEVLSLVGHPVGGVCPFAVNDSVKGIYIDQSIKKYSTVYPACGSTNSAIELSCDELFTISNAADWVDVTKPII